MKKAKKIERIVIYPGFFNPFQKQHEKIVRRVSKQLQYKQIWIFLNDQTNYKDYLLPFATRVKIIKQLFENDSKVIVKTTKIPYITNQLLKGLQKNTKQAQQFWLLLGSDNWNQLAKWEEGEQLKTKTHFLIAKRKGFPLQAQILPSKTQKRVLPITPQPLNSSAIRKGQNWKWLNPKTRQLLFENGNGLLKYLLKQNLSKEKFHHVDKVFKTMQNLNRIYQLKQKHNEIKMSAWFHDWAKDWTQKETYAFWKEHRLAEKALIQLPFAVWHSKSSALYLAKELCYQNPTVLKAISLHTTGGAKMSILAKLLFVADKIEPTKTSNQASYLRKEVGKISFKQLFRKTLQNVIANLKKKGKKLTTNTKAAAKKYLE